MNLAPLSRWLHLYLSMVSFAIVLFFAVTGLTLNHAGWFDRGHQRTRQFKGTLEPRWLRAPDQGGIAKLEVVEFLRRTHGIRGAFSDFRIDDAQCSVSFKGPGYAADAFIDRQSGGYELSETHHGLVAVLNDLHKGRDTGGAWSLVIDVSAGLMVLVSATGTVLVLYLSRRRAAGLWVALAGGLVCLTVYLAFVP